MSIQDKLIQEDYVSKLNYFAQANYLPPPVYSFSGSGTNFRCDIRFGELSVLDCSPMPNKNLAKQFAASIFYTRYCTNISKSSLEKFKTGDAPQPTLGNLKISDPFDSGDMNYILKRLADLTEENARLAKESEKFQNLYHATFDRSIMASSTLDILRTKWVILTNKLKSAIHASHRENVVVEMEEITTLLNVVDTTCFNENYECNDLVHSPKTGIFDIDSLLFLSKVKCGLIGHITPGNVVLLKLPIRNEGFSESMALSWNALMHVLNGNTTEAMYTARRQHALDIIRQVPQYDCTSNLSLWDYIQSSSFSSYLQRLHNSLMHSINGNPETVKIEVKEPKTKKPKTKKKSSTPSAKKAAQHKVASDMEKAYKHEVKSTLKERHLATTMARNLTGKHSLGYLASHPSDLIVNRSKGQVTRARLAAQLAEMICLPNVAPGCRWPDQYGVTETVHTKMKIEITASWAGGATPTAHLLPLTDNFIMLFRSCLRSYVRYDLNASGASFQYDVYGVSNSNTGGAATPTTSFTVNVFATDFTQLPMSYALPHSTTAGQYLPYGNLLPFARDNASNVPGRFFWLNPNDVVVMTVSPQNNAGISCYIYLWSPNGVNGYDIQSLGAITGGATATATFNAATTGGYYKVAIYSTVQTLVTVSAMSIKGGGTAGYGVMCHTTVPQFFANSGSVNTIRMTGLAITYTNDAPKDYRTGEIVSFQARKGSLWNSFLSMQNSGTSTALQQLTSYASAQQREITQGAYTWLRPSSNLSFDFLQEMTVNNGILVDTHYDIIPNDDFSCHWANVPNLSSNNFTPQSGFWTVSYDYEYTTSNIWLNAKRCMLMASAGDDAIAIVRHVPLSSENPLHIREMWNSVKKGANSIIAGAEKYLPIAKTIMGALASL
jgi:hypothetical protein